MMLVDRNVKERPVRNGPKCPVLCGTDIFWRQNVITAKWTMAW